ncbi:ABC transporter permease [Paenibacillus alginolyticus]|uniref:ABC transporter permease n=1 Tax=Paenibacillus alginolyticus TaxID=59839 RepID=UPI0004122CD3|nr:ABC transporter permease [Paenibacillus alginolyticus]MCY9665810.1 ABC transporter permease [Paenibacillus alginolyticus]
MRKSNVEQNASPAPFVWKYKLNYTRFSTIIGLVILCVVISVLSPVFLTTNNLLNVSSQITVNAILALGMTFVILTGGIDLSVGAVVAVSGIVMGLLMKADVPVGIAMLACVAIGTVIGLLNGLMVTMGKLPSFIATLGMMSVSRALALILSSGAVLSTFPDSFRWIGVSKIPFTSIPAQVLLMIILYTVGYYILVYRKTGRFIYAIGGNPEVTRLSGINTKKYINIAYIISGMTSAIAAIVLTSKLNAAQPSAGYNYELDAIAAVVIGGTSLSGGVGSVWGTLIGAAIMGVLRNGLNLLNASSYLQTGIIGLVIIAAVLLDTIKKKV